ncbi:diguanylate cyclase (GGDEF)-like protein [Biostraticola tofi]|uniref:diguanylate cyclase n=1 Tax=Biostraticola tofi TaxID=466109 RepID=A0A4R3Z038_9GAMM|nr:diguanylate cyclase (GGDEF)-like protein [Biostraticola tofi]
MTIRITYNTLLSLKGLMLSVLYKTAPLTRVTLLSIWLLCRLISKPLWHLAQRANDRDHPLVFEKIKRISSWYFEAAQLKKAMPVGISLLHKKITHLKSEVQTDPMTGLYNRCGLKLAVAALREAQQPFAIIAMDIDHFIKINDTWGHDMGDEVIKRLGQLIQSCSRESDISCRSGGEEFLLLLPAADRVAFLAIAERLRTQAAAEHVSGIKDITLSLGIAFYHPRQDKSENVFKLADKALYLAKYGGRNRTVMLEQ